MDKQNQEMDKLLFYNVLDDQTSQHKAEHGGDVGHRAVNLSLRRAPLMVQKLACSIAMLLPYIS